MLVNRVEQQIIRKNHPAWKFIDEMCFNSKNLYNYANYLIRQEFIESNKYLTYQKLNKDLKVCQQYKDCMSQPANCTLRLLDKTWKSFFQGLKEYQKHPDKFLGKPNVPQYLKKNGRFIWMIPNNSCYYDVDNQELKFRIKKLSIAKWKCRCLGRLIQVRFIPRGNVYVMEIVYETEVSKISNVEISKRIMGIDLGINNLITASNNIGESPFIINGKPLKSINQFYNKRKALIQSELQQRNNQSWSKQLEEISFKRFNVIKNYMHNASYYVVKWCIDNKIDTIVIGHNVNWKQKINMKDATNQNFSYIPYDMLISQIKYKSENVGIKVIITEESYTSGTSFLDGEFPCKLNYNIKRRVKRGLFKSNKIGQLINSDVNGSLQIIKKVFPNAFGDGIEVCLTPTIINMM